mmetsp:Transcript_68587/g.178635  ORF Transcript_68587/g.178635 Transcript_68587/m.178635 type:complete len:314 (+) Transcript_68587:154-1095(+)
MILVTCVTAWLVFILPLVVVLPEGRCRLGSAPARGRLVFPLHVSGLLRGRLPSLQRIRELLLVVPGAWAAPEELGEYDLVASIQAAACVNRANQLVTLLGQAAKHDRVARPGPDHGAPTRGDAVYALRGGLLAQALRVRDQRVADDVLPLAWLPLLLVADAALLGLTPELEVVPGARHDLLPLRYVLGADRRLLVVPVARQREDGASADQPLGLAQQVDDEAHHALRGEQSVVVVHVHVHHLVALVVHAEIAFLNVLSRNSAQCRQPLVDEPHHLRRVQLRRLVQGHGRLGVAPTLLVLHHPLLRQLKDLLDL